MTGDTNLLTKMSGCGEGTASAGKMGGGDGGRECRQKGPEIPQAQQDGSLGEEVRGIEPEVHTIGTVISIGTGMSIVKHPESRTTNRES